MKNPSMRREKTMGPSAIKTSSIK